MVSHHSQSLVWKNDQGDKRDMRWSLANISNNTPSRRGRGEDRRGRRERMKREREFCLHGKDDDVSADVFNVTCI